MTLSFSKDFASLFSLSFCFILLLCHNLFADEQTRDSTLHALYESTKIDSSQQDSSKKTLVQKSVVESKTCSELYSELKESRCGKSVFRFLKNASIYIGGSLSLSRIRVFSHDSLNSTLVGIFTPSPYYSISWPPKYFGGWNWGYQYSFLYTTSFAVKQYIERGSKNTVVDLQTLSVFNMAAATPSLFYGIGGQDSNPNTYMRIGIGLGVGWANVKGVAYPTQKRTKDNQGCYDISTQYLENNVTADSIVQHCNLQSFKHSSFGVSGRVFLDGRWNFLYGAIETTGVTINHHEKSFNPNSLSFRLAYVARL